MTSDERPRGCPTEGHGHRLTFRDGFCRGCWYARKRRRRAQGRASSVKRLYGWLTEEVEALTGYQRGRCAICLRRVGVVKAGAMDHDHALEADGRPMRETVRGILCSTCNRYLGHIGDDPAVMIRGAMYLIDPPAPKVLRSLDRDDSMDMSASPSGRDVGRPGPVADMSAGARGTDVPGAGPENC